MVLVDPEINPCHKTQEFPSHPQVPSKRPIAARYPTEDTHCPLPPRFSCLVYALPILSRNGGLCTPLMCTMRMDREQNGAPCNCCQSGEVKQVPVSLSKSSRDNPSQTNMHPLGFHPHHIPLVNGLHTSLYTYQIRGSEDLNTYSGSVSFLTSVTFPTPSEY